jgi:hypothetical protein
MATEVAFPVTETGAVPVIATERFVEDAVATLPNESTVTFARV